ncbi:EAL domain-containing protein [Marinobacterium sp. AK62]|uniref:EAL domain-containing protein n=1 Tax=Marinobacterium alkalitolerans TaxID=1542925 RepID=A0ABS3Z6K2_9GAMM|nr:GGDEF domain-containing protein [Marinobacterium alkalitolerans]MBP0047320.1 EAL domain-containing protein [Marinobacterium alkalitolerans]
MQSANEQEIDLSLEELDHILGLQQAICGLVASDTPYLDVINETCRMAEQLLPGSVASFMALDDNTGKMDVVAAPSVPPEGVERLSGLRPGPQSGSCGNAVYRNEPAFISNTLDDPRWEDLRSIAVDFNLLACWSMPVRDERGQVIGSFALSSFEHRSPSNFHMRLLEVGAALISIAQVRQAQHQRLQAEREILVYRLEHDPLTGLPNAQGLLQALAQTGDEACLVLINLNNLGLINARYGLKTGDRLLRAFSVALGEIAGDGRVFRASGDEFALLYDQLRSPDDELERLRQRFFKSPVPLGDLSFYVTFNAGISTGGEDLLRCAMVALKQARLRGKNATYRYNVREDQPDPQQQLDYIGWSARLHEALQSGGVRAWYQGIRDNSDGVIRKWEALVRLEHEGEVYGPGQFLPVAELIGLMPTITRLVLEQAVDQLSRQSGAISVNITETDLELGYLPDFLEQLVVTRGVDPNRLILEIHEGVSSGSKQAYVEQLQLLKRQGYQLAIDDFGTEYSNFERILELEIDTLKIDAKYIRNLHQDATSYEIVRAIVFFARNAGIRTVAEFVHSPDVQAAVEALGIEESQGFLVSEPAPVPAQ